MSKAAQPVQFQILLPLYGIVTSIFLCLVSERTKSSRPLPGEFVIPLIRSIETRSCESSRETEDTAGETAHCFVLRHGSRTRLSFHSFRVPDGSSGPSLEELVSPRASGLGVQQQMRLISLST